MIGSLDVIHRRPDDRDPCIFFRSFDKRLQRLFFDDGVIVNKPNISMICFILQGLLNSRVEAGCNPQILETCSQMRFGEMAITLGYMDNDQLDDLLDTQKLQRPGLSEVLFGMGLVRKGVLQKQRRAFLRGMEEALT